MPCRCRYLIAHKASSTSAGPRSGARRYRCFFFGRDRQIAAFGIASRLFTVRFISTWVNCWARLFTVQLRVQNDHQREVFPINPEHLLDNPRPHDSIQYFRLVLVFRLKTRVPVISAARCPAFLIQWTCWNGSRACISGEAVLKSMITIRGCKIMATRLQACDRSSSEHAGAPPDSAGVTFALRYLGGGFPAGSTGNPRS